MADKYPREQYGNLVTPFESYDFDMHFTPLYRFYFRQLTHICMRLFIFDGIPKTIDETFFKYCLIINGNVAFFRLDQAILDNRQSGIYKLQPGDLVVQPCNKAEIQTIYYMHRRVLVTNPVFSKTYNLTPGDDCEIVYLTEPDKYFYSMYGGLFALIGRTATILADNDISINVAQKNTRLTNVISADDKPTAISAEAAIEAMYDGDPYKIAQSSLVSDLHSFPMTQATSSREIVQLVEIRQYIYSHFYESIGIGSTHDNMKRERLISAELDDGVDLAAINIDDMLATVREGLERVNAMFGTTITVELNPIIKRATEQEDGSVDDPPPAEKDENPQPAEQEDDPPPEELEDDPPPAEQEDDPAPAEQDEDPAPEEDSAADAEANVEDEPQPAEQDDDTEPAEPAPIEIKIEAQDDSKVIVKIDSDGEDPVEDEDTPPPEREEEEPAEPDDDRKEGDP